MLRGSLSHPLNNLVLITGHRGMGVSEKPRHQFFPAIEFYPENSLEAFDIAIECGVSCIECDIHVSQDGVAMVIHGSKIAPYADLISTLGMGTKEQEDLNEWLLCIPSKAVDPTKKSISLDDLLQVERFTAKVLQSCFSLKAYDVKAKKTPDDTKLSFFDELTSQEKKNLLPDEIKRIVDEKAKLLTAEAKRHQIPTLTELLNFLYNKNKRREGRVQPNIKLNIELKGKGSAIASIFTLLEFYEQRPDAQRYVKPDDIIFLGKREVGEISIANAMLKGLVEIRSSARFVIPELFNYFLKEDTKEKEKFKTKYRTELVFVRAVNRIFAPYASSNGQDIDNVTRGYLLMLAYVKAGGQPASFFPFLESTIPTIEDVQAQLKLLWQDRGDSDWKSKFNKEVTCLLAHKNLSLLNSYMQASTTEEAYLEKKMGPLFLSRQQPMVDQMMRRLASYNDKPCDSSTSKFIQEQKLDAVFKVIAEKLGCCPTNLMLSTGDLFGVKNLANDADFNLKPGILEINEDAKNTIKEALKDYKYEGIDLSLFDYCSSILDAIKEAITEGTLDRTKLILGASASNWRAAPLDNIDGMTGGCIKDPFEVPQRALAIVREIQIPLLVKVDEPGSFEHLKNKLERLQRTTEALAQQVLPVDMYLMGEPTDSALSLSAPVSSDHPLSAPVSSEHAITQVTSFPPFTPINSGNSLAQRKPLRFFPVESGPMSRTITGQPLLTGGIHSVILETLSVNDNVLFDTSCVHAARRGYNGNQRLEPCRKPPRGVRKINPPEEAPIASRLECESLDGSSIGVCLKR